MVILIIGLLLCGIAVIVWTLEPINDSICKGRWWSIGLGMVVFSAGVFCRSFQLKKIHQLVKNGKYKSSKKINHIKLLFMIMGILTAIELILLLLLEITTPSHSVVVVTDVINRTGQYKCDNSIPFIWMILQSIYLVFILGMGIYFMYSTWGISSSVDDTRINILMIFLCLVTLGVSDVIVSYTNQSELAVSWWALSLIIVWSLSMMCSIFIPKLIKHTKSSSGNEMSSTSTSTVKTSHTSHNASS